MSGSKIGFNHQTANNFDPTREQSAPTKTPVQTKVSKTDEYTVKRGDTLTEIAVKTGQNLRQLLEKNPQIKNPNLIRVGQHIEIGKATDTYTVKKGDTLSAIARTHHTSVGDIMRANPGRINNRNLIYPGQKLHLPTRETKTTTTKPETTTQTPTPTTKPTDTTTPTTTQPKPDDTKTQTPVGDKPPVDTGKTEPYARSPHLKLKTKGIELSPLVEKKMSQIADEYFRRTGKNLTITDGNRTAHDQAERIYDKIQHGGENIYTNKKALAEIKAAYSEGAARGESREQIVGRMARVIQNQAGRNVYISKHLTGQGADVRISDMTAADKKAFLESVAKVGGAHKLNEGNHWHMEIDENQKPPAQTPTTTPTTTPTPQTEQSQGTNTGNTSQSQSTTSSGWKVAKVSVDDFLNRKQGATVLAAVIIGHAEGNIDIYGKPRKSYYGHPDPGDGLWNIGSFSRANARFPNSPPARSPEEADRMHLKSLQSSKEKFTSAMEKAGLDPENVWLQSTYFDELNQAGPDIANKMLEPKQLEYIKNNGVTPETMKEWRMRGYINRETGQRWVRTSGRLKGVPFGSSFKTEAALSRDQQRRADAIAEVLKNIKLIEKSESKTQTQVGNGKKPPETH